METPIDHLLPEIYDQLKGLARLHRSRIFAKKGLGTRSIVHEAYLKIQHSNAANIADQQQFLYLASTAMRSVLVDNARHWARDKRGGQLQDLSLDQVELTSAKRGDELIELDKALLDLSKDNERLSNVVTCRFFGGLSLDETAAALDISRATVKRDWILARTLLYQALNSSDESRPA